MKNIIFCFLISSIFFSSVNLHSSEESEGVTSERMAILKLLMHKNLMLTFVSHPKTMEYFLRERQRKNDYMISLRTEVESLKEQFPSDPAMMRFSEGFFSQIDLIENPFPYEEVVMPFLACGLANLYGIEDEEVVKRIQYFQVKLFKNYLYGVGIGNFATDQTHELELFSRNCSLPIFSQLISPILQALLERDAEIDDIVDFYSSDKHENLTAEQKEELEDVYNPPKSSELSIKCPPFKLDLSELDIGLDDAFWEEFEKNFYPCGKEGCPSEAAIEGILKKVHAQNFFSLEQLIELFFEVMVEVYPDHKEFFEDAYKKR